MNSFCKANWQSSHVLLDDYIDDELLIHALFYIGLEEGYRLQQCSSVKNHSSCPVQFDSIRAQVGQMHLVLCDGRGLCIGSVLSILCL